MASSSSHKSLHKLAASILHVRTGRPESLAELITAVHLLEHSLFAFVFESCFKCQPLVPFVSSTAKQTRNKVSSNKVWECTGNWVRWVSVYFEWSILIDNSICSLAPIEINLKTVWTVKGQSIQSGICQTELHPTVNRVWPELINLCCRCLFIHCSPFGLLVTCCSGQCSKPFRICLFSGRFACLGDWMGACQFASHPWPSLEWT